MDMVQVTAKVPEHLVARLDNYAGEHRWSRATAIQALLEQGMEMRGHSYCVYLLRDPDVVYVGSSRNLSARLATHRRNIDYSFAEVIPCSTKEEALELESELIMKHQPPRNASGLLGRPDPAKVTVSLDGDLRKTLALAAEARGLTVPALITRIIDNHLETTVPAERELVAAITGADSADVHDLPATPAVTTLPALDKRIAGAADALMDEWSAGAGTDPRGERGAAVRERVEVLLRDGYVPADIQRGLAAWDGEHPASIPAFVTAAMSGAEDHGES